MKKFIFSIICIIIVAIVVDSVYTKKEEITDSNTEVKNNEIDDYGDGFYIETLSDKDIYYHGTSVCLTNMPQSKKEVYGDMVSLANSYAILRAAVARALVGSGLYPAFGIFHRNRYNAFPLADDVMEPYRPFVDEIVHSLYCNEKTTTNRHDSGIYQLLVICRTCIEGMEERQEYRDAGSFRAARDHVQQRHADYQDHQYHH